MKKLTYTLLIAISLILAGCANAGKDQTVHPGDTVTLDGTKSDGNIQKYSWKQVSGEAVTLSGQDTATATFVVPSTATSTVLMFGLKVLENKYGRSGESVDYVRITVVPEADTTKPVIALLGDTEVNLTVGDDYIDAGATAQDDRDGNLTGSIVVTGLPIDTNVTGSYTVTYDVGDAAGNGADTVSRVVNVVEASKPLKSLFYQPWLSDAELNKQSNIYWNYVFSEMKKANMDTLILQWTKAYDEDFIDRPVYDVENKEKTTWLKEILTKAKNHQIKVIIGLDSDKDFFTNTQKGSDSNLDVLEEYFSGLKKSHIDQMKAILQYTQDKNLEFDGWYIPDEYDNVNIYDTSGRRQAIIKQYLSDLSEEIGKVSTLPVSISAFFNSTDIEKLEPEPYAEMLNYIMGNQYTLFMQTGLGTNHTDKDGVGVDKYFEAFNAHYNSKIIPVIEGFEISYKADGNDSYNAMDTESFYNQIDRLMDISKEGGFALFSFRYFFYYDKRLLEAYQNKYTPQGNILIVDQNSTDSSTYQTIQKAINAMDPGDTVLVKAGIYHEHVVIMGMEKNSTTIKNYGDGRVIIDGSSSKVREDINATWDGLVYMDSVKYITFSGIEIRHSSQRGILLNYTEHIKITNVKTYDTNSSGIGVSESNHILVDNNEVELACNGGQEESISIVQSSDVNVTNNEVHHNGGGENGGEGIDIKEGSHDVNVINNHVHHIYSCFGTGRPGIYADAWNKETYNIVISDNNVHDVQAGAFSLGNECGGDLYDVNITNNIAYNNKGEAIIIGGWTNQPCVERNETGNAKTLTKDGNVTKYVENPIRNVNMANNSFYISDYEDDNKSFCDKYPNDDKKSTDTYGGIYIDNLYPESINITDNIIQSDGTIKNSSIDGNISISEENLNISNNILYSAPYSIYEINAKDNNTIANNLFKDPKNGDLSLK